MIRVEKKSSPEKNTTISYLTPNDQPQNIYTNNIIQNKQVVFLWVGIYTYIYTSISKY